ncbi:MAG: M67 family metallopeptidase [Acidobacteria bacterium]|nr:M67 family metallopeptidase [Acidobacteriota bacterium]
MSDSNIRITATVRAAIETHALESQPQECCGLLSGTNDVISQTYRLRNQAENPLTNYFAAPDDLFRAMQQMREAGESLRGIYHSHPRSSAYPSPTDVEMAFYPEAIYFIISLAPRPELRAYRIHHSQIEEVKFAVIDAA